MKNGRNAPLFIGPCLASDPSDEELKNLTKRLQHKDDSHLINDLACFENLLETAYDTNK